MPTIKCNRCGVSYDIREKPAQSNSKTFVCEVPRCTRRYMETMTVKSVKLYQTPDNVTATILAAREKVKHGHKVDNGGDQDERIKNNAPSSLARYNKRCEQ